jgi:uncharacterized protein YjbJ (UPF0337 family)
VENAQKRVLIEMNSDGAVRPHREVARTRRILMGFGDTSDKVEHKGEEVAGKVKEEFGDATDNERLEAEGKVQQSGAQAKQAGDDVADALRDASNAVKGMTRDDDKT